jgi:hypothetical protein
MNAPSTSLAAAAADIPEIDSLLCSAQEPIGLKSEFCADENRLARLNWLEEKLKHKLLHVICDQEGIAGALILNQDPMCAISDIGYIVVAERKRGCREIGPSLVKCAQLLANGGPLKAEARNDHSRHLLEQFGFLDSDEVSSTGHPILVWRHP